MTGWLVAREVLLGLLSVAAALAVFAGAVVFIVGVAGATMLLFAGAGVTFALVYIVGFLLGFRSKR